MKFRVKDEVQVIAGKDIGKRGTIIKAMPKDNKVVIEGVNIAKRHRKATQKNQTAAIVEQPMPIDASNVMLIVDGKPTRVGFKVKEDGTKVRVAKKSGKEV
jgi:large subunit ribosomal protein L24